MSYFYIFILSISLASTPLRADVGEEPSKCAQVLSSPSPVIPASELAQTVAAHVDRDLQNKGWGARDARGFSVLIAAMVGSAALTTYVSASLPADLQFISHFLAQASVLGVYKLGAPIWEPLGSGFRKLAFGVQGRPPPASVARAEFEPTDFEGLWWKTQATYSLNAQMSRNVISQFIISVHQNFYEAYRANQSGQPIYAADQVAEAAFRLRTLFRDIPPDDTSVARAVRTAFTNHVVVDQEFIDLVLQKIKNLDESYNSPIAKHYYGKIMTAWLNRNP